MQMFKKIVNIVIDVLIVIMLIVSALVAGLALASRADGVPNLFGYAPLSVQTDSMVPTFESGDLIISKVVEDVAELKEDDIITFTQNIAGEKSLNTHRIIEVQETGGFIFFETKGDNNPVQDEELVSELDVLAVYTGTTYKGWGNFYDFITSQFGFFLVILLPLILFFLYEVFRVVRNLIEYNKEKAYEAALQANASTNSGLSEEEMKIAVEKYLQQQAQQNNQTMSENTDVDFIFDNTEE